MSQNRFVTLEHCMTWGLQASPLFQTGGRLMSPGHPGIHENNVLSYMTY